MTENEAQTRIINYFLNTFSCTNPIVIVEFPFCEHTRRADVVFIVNDFTHAVEIKTEGDNIRTIDSQIKDYKKIFDFNYIATEGKNFRRIIKNNYGSAGILKLDEKVKMHRNARQVKRLDKVAMLSSVDFAYLKKQDNTVVKSGKHDSIIASANRLNKDESRNILIRFICDRYKRRSDSFLNEIGESIHTDDLLLLSRPSADLS
ncbi:sce7726 family protein [Thermodesulfobacteriota bacterium]